MLSSHVKGKVAVFIDAANMFYAERQLGWHIDFQALAHYLYQEMRVVGLYYYTGVLKENTSQISFLRKLESFGYVLIAKEVKLIQSSNATVKTKGSLDVELALDAYIRRDEYETILLFSGDSDFAYLIDVLKRDGKHAVTISTRGHIARELISRTKYVPLSRLKTHIERSAKIKGPARPAPEVH